LIILASASPRRADILLRHGVEFCLDPANIDESPLANEGPDAYVVRVAEAKAENRLPRLAESKCSLVLAADTCVSLDSNILGKPENLDHFVSMFELLSGQTHKVYTGVSLAGRPEAAFRETMRESILVSTEVSFREIGIDQILKYWNSGEPQDKAGGYGIQGLAAEFIERIEGSYSNVVGLPICETMQLLDRWHIEHSLGPKNV
jgi:septum formation protein|tara:strand:+ start:63599 stop:64210 length:612 start_codon:yes stop_codon:yes gene_type:complete